jgi:hypothetical protein
MKEFISWSGDRSKAMAEALKTWLGDVFQGDHVFMSEHDVDAGARWGYQISDELASSDFGIICLTPENQKADWLLFEAGALSKAVETARVVPYRLGVKATDVDGPLAQFQGVDADETGTFKLLESINSVRESKLPKDQLERSFKKWWPDLQNQLSTIPPQSESTPQRPERDLLEEILQIARTLQQQPPVGITLDVSGETPAGPGELTEGVHLGGGIIDLGDRISIGGVILPKRGAKRTAKGSPRNE